MAPAHMMQGSTVTYNVQSCRYFPPNSLAAMVIACISACAVTSLSVSVVVCRDRIIARAHNLTETLNDVTAHAEMQAITMAANELGGKYLQDCTLYVTVEPCIMCAGAIGWAQLQRIVYGCPDEKRGYHEYAPKAFHPKAKVTYGVMEEECRALMQRFFQERR